MNTSERIEVQDAWGPKSVWIVGDLFLTTEEVVAYMHSLVGDGNLREQGFGQALDEAWLLTEDEPFERNGHYGFMMTPSTVEVIGAESVEVVASDEFGEVRLVELRTPEHIIHRSHSGDTFLTLLNRGQDQWAVAGSVSENAALGLPERVKAELPGYVEPGSVVEEVTE